LNSFGTGFAYLWVMKNEALTLLKKGLLFLFLPLMAFTSGHKFYVSVTNISYSEKDSALQITTRVFIDDLENVLGERYGVQAHLATGKESDQANFYIEKYLKAKFVLRINGKNAAYRFLGKKYDNDLIVCYLEVADIDFPTLSSIEVQNEVLTDLYDEQQNIVHFKINGTRKSFVLVRDNNKGMLNL